MGNNALTGTNEILSKLDSLAPALNLPGLDSSLNWHYLNSTLLHKRGRKLYSLSIHRVECIWGHDDKRTRDLRPMGKMP